MVQNGLSVEGGPARKEYRCESKRVSAPNLMPKEKVGVARLKENIYNHG